MTTKTTTDIGSGAALLRKLLAYGQALDAEIEAKTCRDAEGRFASCGLATGNSHEGSARRRNAGKRRRQGPQTGVGAVSRKARRKRAGRKNASRRKWLEDLKANKYGAEGKHLYRSQFKEQRELADVIKSERRESRADERSQRRDLAREIKAERKETRRDQSKERARLKRDQAKETDRESRAFDRQDARLDAKYETARAAAKNPASIERQYRERKQELADARAERMQDLSDEHKQARRDLRDSHRSDREMQRLEQQQRSDSLKDDFRSARVDEHLSHREQAFDLHETHRAERAELIREHINERREERGEKSYKTDADDDAETKALMELCGTVLDAIGTDLKAEKKPSKKKPKKKPKKRPGSSGRGSGAGCGTGAGGFKPGNTCGRRPGGSAAKPAPDPNVSPPKPPDSARTAVKRRWYEDEQERVVARTMGGKRLVGYEPYDVEAPKSDGKGKHVIEVKTLHYGSANKLSVHPGALADKARYAAANRGDTFHTIVQDKRATSEDGVHADKYSGHEVYYKRASGPYSLSKMYKCKDLEEAKRLMETPYAKLPPEAKGKFPTTDELSALKAKAKADREYNNQRSRERKQRLGRAAYGKPPKPEAD